MAKTQCGFEEDEFGRVHKFAGKVDRHQRKSQQAGPIPWTRGPQTRWQKFKRAAVG